MAHLIKRQPFGATGINTINIRRPPVLEMEATIEEPPDLLSEVAIVEPPTYQFQAIVREPPKVNVNLPLALSCKAIVSEPRF